MEGIHKHKFKLMADYLASIGYDRRSCETDIKFKALNAQEFDSLLIDITDELKRRMDSEMPFLPILLHYHRSRNQARQKLAKIDSETFHDLLCNLCNELEERINDGFCMFEFTIAENPLAERFHGPHVTDSSIAVDKRRNTVNLAGKGGVAQAMTKDQQITELELVSAKLT
jgi:hypothetical protein